MQRTRPQRAAAVAAAASGAYDENTTGVLYTGSAGKRQRWQTHAQATAASDDEEGAEDGTQEKQCSAGAEEAAEAPRTPQKRGGKRPKRAPPASAPTAMRPEGTPEWPAEEDSGPPLTAEEHARLLEEWTRRCRNTNTSVTYTLSFMQFAGWAVGEGSRRLAEPIDPERPSDAAVADYARHMVMAKGHPMSTVNVHMAAISDRLRFTDLSPCTSKLVQAMLGVLKDRAPMSGTRQKKELSGTLLRRLVSRMKAHAKGCAKGSEERWLTLRDMAMVTLGYFCFLRRSEIARMRRGHVTFEAMEDGSCLMKVYVHELCKNDTERRGHERLVAARKGDPACPVRMLAVYLNSRELFAPAAGQTQEGDGKEDPLFPKRVMVKGKLVEKELSSDTPNSRLKHWLGVLGEDPAEYGFHSLRAGAATDAHRAGVSERLIKLHGNWKSDTGVQPYLRAGREERLAASNALRH